MPDSGLPASRTEEVLRIIRDLDGLDSLAELTELLA